MHPITNYSMAEERTTGNRIREIEKYITGECNPFKSFVRKNGKIYVKIESGKNEDLCELTKDNYTEHVPILGYFNILDKNNRGKTTGYQQITIPPEIAINDLAKLIKEFISLPIDQSTSYTWLHSATHFLEGFNNSSGVRSIFEVPEYQPIANALVDSYVIKAKEYDSNKSLLLRVTKSMSLYNLHNISENALDIGFPFKPNTLNDKTLRERFDTMPNLTNKKELLFLESKTPREFIEKLVKNDCYISKDLFLKLQGLIKNVVGEEKFQEYESGLRLIYDNKALITQESDEKMQDHILDTQADHFITNIGGLKLIAKNLKKIKDIINKPALEGIYVDVEKTLIIDGNLNTDLVEKLTEAKNYGINITIFSSADPEEQTRRLKELGMDIGETDSTFSSVRPKSGYLGEKLLLLIDDTNAAAQGFLAVTHITPDRSESYRSLIDTYESSKKSIAIVSLDFATKNNHNHHP